MNIMYCQPLKSPQKVVFVLVRVIKIKKITGEDDKLLSPTFIIPIKV